jgi:hypothetical protein
VRKKEKLTVVNYYAELRCAGTPSGSIVIFSAELHGSTAAEADLNLLLISVPMIWLFPVTILVIGASALVRARLRARSSRSLTTDPVSGQWLAEARSREEHPW